MTGSDFIFDCVHLLFRKCHKINPNWDGSYIDSPDWIKNEKVKINHINNDDKYFQYTASVALNHKEIGNILQSISKNMPFINKYNWEGVNYPSVKDDWKNLKKIM